MKKLISITAISLVFIGFSCESRPGNPSKRGPGRDGPPPSLEEVFTRFDINEDGKLSEAEVKGPLKNDFAKLDTDEDGFLSKEELEKAPKPQRPQRPGPPPGGRE